MDVYATMPSRGVFNLHFSIDICTIPGDTDAIPVWYSGAHLAK
jgi:hypothetical protein